MFKIQLRLINIRTISALGNRKVVWVLSLRPFTNSKQYCFQILLCQVDIFHIFLTKESKLVTKMCPKYLLTLYQNFTSKYQRHVQINRSRDINNVQHFEVFTLYASTNMADTRIVCPICTVITSHTRLDIAT